MNDHSSDSDSSLSEDALPAVSPFTLAGESADSSVSSTEDGSEVDADVEEEEEEDDFVVDTDEDRNSCQWQGLRTVGELPNAEQAVSSPEPQEPNTDRFFDLFYDYFGLNDLVHKLAVGPPSVDDESHGELNGRRGSMSSMGSDTYDGYGDLYGDCSPPPFSPSGGHLQDYFTGSEYDRLAGNSRRDLSLVQRRGKMQSGRSYQTQPKVVCVFCRNNGEAESLYASHALKDATGKVTCPILRAYTCPVCKAHGDNAHTLKYCPKNDSPAARQAQAAAASRGRPGAVRRREKLPSVGSVNSFAYM